MKIPKQVTERDFRRPEFRDADPNDYEFREDGAIVRKDRWEQGIRSIAGQEGMSGTKFEVADIVAKVDEMAKTLRAVYRNTDEHEILKTNKQCLAAWKLGKELSHE